MLFQTPAFLLFLIATVVLMSATRGRARKGVLLAASWFFYGWWSVLFLAPLLLTTFFDFGVGILLERTAGDRRRKQLVGASVAVNLALLVAFKYFDFLSATAFELLNSAGVHRDPPLLHVILPIGISFYTFHSISYVVDVYRRQLPACRSLLDYSLFIAFFPVLVAGPIVRGRHFLPQLERGVRLRPDGGTLLRAVRGLAKKVLIADNLAPLVNAVFALPGDWPSILIWVATVAFAVQIYCDFSGYTDIALALAQFFGFELPSNFDHPYFARNASDFWRRWHISLSAWLRDYLYIPLGGNRDGRLRTLRNVMITMLLGGLWHGASWNFVLWGAMHGALLVTHRLWRMWRGAAPQTRWRTAGATAATQLAVLFTWIAFRVQDARRMSDAMRKFVSFDFNFALAGRGLTAIGFFTAVAAIAAFAVVHVLSYSRGELDAHLARAPRALLIATSVAIGFIFFWLWPADQIPFIYFQF